MAPALATVEQVMDKKFDHVIISSGTSGNALAARPTENPEISVLVLEAGQAWDNDPNVEMLTGFLKQLGNPEYDCIFKTTPQKNLGGKEVIWRRGKGLGGSSNMNFMMWSRPGKDEIDAWEKLGNKGWNHENFIPYIRKAENFHAPPEGIIKRDKLQVEPSWYGKAGPINVSYSEGSFNAEPIIRIPLVDDPINGKYSGTWTCATTTNPNTLACSSAFKGYVLPRLDRPNLSILVKSYVIKILIDSAKSDSVTATGVEFTHGDATYTVGANKEVIVSAGALKFPQILELSGIGDPKVLKPLGIDLKVDLPSVGTNMQDQAADISVSWEVTPESGISSLNKLGDPEFLQQELGAYFSQKRSLLANVVSGVSFLSLQHVTDKAKDIIAKHEKALEENPPNPDMPVFEIIVNPVLTGWINKAKAGKCYISLAFVLSNPFSRGTAHITSKDPTTYPALDANYFDHQIDLDIMVEAFKFGRDLANHEPFKKIMAREANPGLNVETEAYIIKHIKDDLCTVWQTSGTLPMLPKEDGGVVDPKFRVYGTSNIRVVDISIIPLQLSIHTQTIAYGIAEKAADIILGKA
ncbi:GMC oxidoreductase [Sphaerobolus stellatus SS14]|uniref:Unplaced genomic scaffold SPHSTscaffold_124, whole genome shotgun sequence n=1 Tax=Sphaerobolus stellatus (strain SS14) TaxID=990650 RepID=A0A0C9VAI5_SPHS4|nr:GMC oxidoreductase [Sphaerobolus stellatus SS14]